MAAAAAAAGGTDAAEATGDESKSETYSVNDEALYDEVRLLVKGDMTADTIVNGVRAFAESIRMDADHPFTGLELNRRVFLKKAGGGVITYFEPMSKLNPFYSIAKYLGDVPKRKADIKQSMLAVTRAQTPLIQRYMTTQRHRHTASHDDAPLCSSREFIWNANMDTLMGSDDRVTTRFINGWSVSALNHWMRTDESFSTLKLNAVMMILGKALGVVMTSTQIAGDRVLLYSKVQVAQQRSVWMYSYWDYHRGDAVLSVDKAQGCVLTAWFVVKPVVAATAVPDTASVMQAAASVAQLETDSIAKDRKPAAAAAAAADDELSTDTAAAASAGNPAEPQPLDVKHSESAGVTAKGIAQQIAQSASARTTGVSAARSVVAAAIRRSRAAEAPAQRPVGASTADAATLLAIDTASLQQKQQFGVEVLKELRREKVLKPVQKTVRIWRILPYLTLHDEPPKVTEEHGLIHVGRVLRVNPDQGPAPKENVFNAAVYPSRLTWAQHLPLLRTIEVCLRIDQHREHYSPPIL
jgi:hypothetical protein